MFSKFTDLKPYCQASKNVSLDFLSNETTLEIALEKAGFDKRAPAVFLAEGLIMYLGEEGKSKFIDEVSSAAVKGSVFILNFMDPSGSAAYKANPDPQSPLWKSALFRTQAEELLEKNGWTDLKFQRFGDEFLNYGRYPLDKFEPSTSFSFVVCTKQ